MSVVRVLFNKKSRHTAHPCLKVLVFETPPVSTFVASPRKRQKPKQTPPLRLVVRRGFGVDLLLGVHDDGLDGALGDQDRDGLPGQGARDAKPVGENRHGYHFVLRHLRHQLVVRALFEKNLVVRLFLVFPFGPLLLLGFATGGGLGGLGGLRFGGFRRLLRVGSDGRMALESQTCVGL